ncbi:hypothetical protein MASR2M78_13940 [Treponema sp.]
MNRNIKPNLILVSICLGIFLSCSSAPKNPPGTYDARNEAARLVQLGSKSLREGANAVAREYYKEAYRIYTAMDEAEGRVRALDGLGRTASPNLIAVGEKTAAQLWVDAALIADESGQEVVKALASLLNAELGLLSQDPDVLNASYASARDAASKLSRYPADQARAYRVAGAGAKALGDYKEALKLLEEAASLDKKERAYAELASDRYLAASIYSKEGDYSSAEFLLLDALKNDRRAEHPAGIAGDYLALGLVAEKSGKIVEASRFYQRSADVYSAIRMEDHAADARARQAKLAAK